MSLLPCGNRARRSCAFPVINSQEIDFVGRCSRTLWTEANCASTDGFTNCTKRGAPIKRSVRNLRPFSSCNSTNGNVLDCATAPELAPVAQSKTLPLVELQDAISAKPPPVLILQFNQW